MGDHITYDSVGINHKLLTGFHLLLDFQHCQDLRWISQLFRQISVVHVAFRLREFLDKFLD